MLGIRKDMMAHRKIGRLALDADSDVPLANPLELVVTLGTTMINVGQLYVFLYRLLLVSISEQTAIMSLSDIN
jgi:hypothetical protein